MMSENSFSRVRRRSYTVKVVHPAAPQHDSYQSNNQSTCTPVLKLLITVQPAGGSTASPQCDIIIKPATLAQSHDIVSSSSLVYFLFVFVIFKLMS